MISTAHHDLARHVARGGKIIDSALVVRLALVAGRFAGPEAALDLARNLCAVAELEGELSEEATRSTIKSGGVVHASRVEACVSGLAESWRSR